MARQVSAGSPSVFTTVAQVSDNTNEDITYQWQIDGVDLIDGTAVPTKSEISSFFYSPNVRNASDRFLLPGDYGFSCGTIGSKEAFVGPYVLQEGFRNGNRVEFDTPLEDDKYFAEFQVNSDWIDYRGFFGVADFTHLNFPQKQIVASSVGETSQRIVTGTNWDSSTGVRMAPWFGARGFLFGERTRALFQRNPQFSPTEFRFVSGDIIGVVVNSEIGAVNLYKNGRHFCTLRNYQAAGRPLYIFLQNRFAIVNDSENPSTGFDLKCTSLTTPSSYSSNYYFPTLSLDQDPSVGSSGGAVEVSGAKTQTLTILSGNVSKYNLKCVITHPTAYNSPIVSDAVELDFISTVNRANLNFEYHPIRNGSVAKLESVDLQDGVEYIIDRSTEYQNITFYSPDRDIEVELEMFGPKGRNRGDFQGGRGGYSVVRFIVEKDTEYAIAGHFIAQFFVFKKSRLIAVTASGGDAGKTGDGGAGGGVSNRGAAGAVGTGPTHLSGGKGGKYILPTEIDQNGISGSSNNQPRDIEPRADFPDGGRTVRCPIGNYWRQQGFSPCQDIGFVRYRHGSGAEVSNSTASIMRGWKPGTGAYRAVRGGGISDGGDGGIGATGGQGGRAGSGGGGGSGYHAPDVVVVNSVQGGSTRDVGRLVFRIAPPLPPTGTFSHSFINSSNITTSLTFSGSIKNIEAQGEAARDAWFGAAGNLNAKHYLITMNQQCSDLKISDISTVTAGGGPPWGDRGMYVAAIQKINSNQFRVWFNRSSGYNTFIRSCTIDVVR